MKKFIVIVIMIIGVYFVATLLLDNRDNVLINYTRLDTMGYDYGSTVFLPIAKAFPQNTIDLLQEAIPELQPSLVKLKEDIEYIKANRDTVMLTSDMMVLTLRNAKEVVTPDVYLNMLQAVLDDLNPKLVEQEDFYTLWKQTKRNCQELRRVIPSDIQQLEKHVQICYYLDDVEQVENYRNSREKDTNKESEQYAQQSIEYMIGNCFQNALIQMVELEMAIEEK